jgi:hypothetical protein
MAKTVRTGLLITGDASGAVKATQVTREELEKLKGQQRSTEASSKSFGDSIRGVGAELGDVAKKAAMAGAALAAVAAGALVKITRDGLASADALGKQSESLGIAAEKLAVYRMAGARAGVAQGTLDKSFGRLTTTIGQAAEGIGTGVRALDRLGLSAEALAEMAPDQQMRILADAVGTVTNQTDRMTIATDLFGRGAARDMLRVLNLGSAGFDSYAEKARIAGIALDNVATTQVAAANDAMADLGSLVDGLGQQLGVQFSPLLQEAAERLFGVAEEAGGMGEVATQAFNAVITAAGFVGDVIQGLRVVIKGVEIAFRAFGAGVLTTIAEIQRGWIELANLIPGIKVDAEKNFLVQTARVARDGLKEARDELVALVNEEMPSTKLREFVADVQRRSEQTAQQVVADQRSIQTATHETEDAVEDLAEASTVAAGQMSNAWDGAASTLRSALMAAFDGSIKSFGDFTSALKRGFSSMLMDLGRQSFGNPIMMQLGLTGGGGAMIAGSGIPGVGAGGSAGGGAMGLLSSASSFGSLLSGGMAGLSGSLTQGVVGASNLLTSLGAGGLATKLQLSAANLSTMPGGLAGGVGLSAGAGIAGSMLSNVLGLSGKHSGTLGALGGIAGTFIGGPIGAGIGSFLGSALGGVIGKGPQVGRIGVDTGGINTRGALAGTAFNAASGLRIQPVAMRSGSEGEQAAKALAEQFGQIDSLLTSALRGAGIAVDLSGARLGGTQASGRGFIGSDIKGGIDQSAIDGAADKFVREWLQAVNADLPRRVRSFMQSGIRGTAEEMATALQQALALDMLIDLDVVNETEGALKALGKEQGTLLEQYGRQVDNVLNLAGEFDRSAGSIETLTDALRSQKEIATELALTYQLLTTEIGAMFQTSIQSIRESLMSDEELYAFRRDEIRRLTSELEIAADPGEIARITQEIDQLSRSAFGQLDEGQQQALGGQFISFLENADRIAQRQLEAGLQQLQERETSLAGAIDLELSVQAANTQLAASNVFADAVAAFQQAVSSGQFAIPATFGFDPRAEVNR